MAEGVNVCVFSGNLTADARSKDVNGTEVARYTVAVNGRKEGETTFVQCSHWKPGGVLQFLKKGKPVCVSGNIRLATWEKDGKQMSAVELSVRSLTLMGGANEKKASDDDFDSPF